jgi:hypothetical protein
MCVWSKPLIEIIVTFGKITMGIQGHWARSPWEFRDIGRFLEGSYTGEHRNFDAISTDILGLILNVFL